MVFPAFSVWAATFGKTYNGDEFEARQAIYDANMAKYEAHNADATQTFTMGPNQFSDLTLEEFQALPIRGFKKMESSGLPKLGSHQHSGKPAVDSIDWVTKGAVTPVKNQGQCGSCWAFSSTGGLEGQWEIATGSLQSMSEQQLVDCSKNGGNAGCNGGLMDNSFEWYENQASATENSYPYTGRDGSCKSSGWTTAVPKGGVTGYKDISSEALLLDAVTNTGPVSVAIEADQSSFQGYSGGVLTGSCGTNLDHGVLAVGFGSESGTDYWKVKNSWGSSWGMNGYVLIQRGVNKCGIQDGPPSYPTVSGAPVPPPAPTPPTPPQPPPAPTPAPTPGSAHYGAPPCQPDETADELVDESGAHIGAICDAKCDTDSDCPQDTPGGSAQPGCILQDSDTGETACGLECGIFGGDCPDGSTCSSQMIGVCYWPGATANGKQFQVKKDVTV